MTRYDLRDAVRERKEQLRGRTTDADTDEGVPARTRADLTDEALEALTYRLAGVGKRHALGYESGFIAALAWLDQDGCFKARED